MKWYKKLLHEKSANLCNSNTDEQLCCVNKNQICNSTSPNCNFNDQTMISSVSDQSEIVRKMLQSNITFDNNHVAVVDEITTSEGALGKYTGFFTDSLNQSLTDSIQSTDRRVELQRQSSILESLISDSLNNSFTSIDTILTDPDEFFDDPVEVESHRKERKMLSEWEVIDISELEFPRVTSCQSFTSAEFHDLLHSAEQDDTDNNDDEASGYKKLKDSCSSYRKNYWFNDDNDDDDDDNNDEDYVQIKRTPSVISLTSYDEDEHGIFYSVDQAAFSIPEAYYHSSFSHDIQSGVYLLRNMTLPIYEDGIWTKGHPSSDCEATFSTNSTSLQIKNLQQTKLKNDLKPLFARTRKSNKSEIKKYFGLSDEGDLILDIDHIVEEHGFGYRLKKNRYAYRNVEIGKAIDEFPSAMESFNQFLNEVLEQLRGLFKGHPRNKPSTGGPGESIGAYALALASDSTSTFSRNIENFISCTKESRELAPQIVMRNMRQFMSGMKNYLVKHGEGDFQREVLIARSRLKQDEFLNLDTILEGVMHKLVVLPLREHLYGLFVDYYTRTSDIQVLVENVKYASSRSAVDFGIRPSVSPPSSAAMHHISVLLLRLQEAELPLEKLDLLLLVVSAIFDSTTHSRGQPLGADDFLPLLVYIVAKCGFISAEIEAEFMWCLLQQSLLSGEAGYYLTALCSAVHVLKSFMASENEGTGSLDIRSSSLPASSSVLRVIIPDECNGSLQTRTLPVRPHTTTKEVCRTIAHKARITNPQDYGLFKLVNGEETLLMDSDCPQEARLEARGKHCMLAYKRIDAKIAWPTLTAT